MADLLAEERVQMIKIKMNDPQELANLMSLEDYNRFCETEQH